MGSQYLEAGVRLLDILLLALQLIQALVPFASRPQVLRGRLHKGRCANRVLCTNRELFHNRRSQALATTLVRSR